MLLAIETSCDETAVAICDLAIPLTEAKDNSEFLKAELISSQTKLHKEYGGVVPELASREHLINLPQLIRQVLDDARITMDDITVIAVTRGPGLKGCLLVGLTFAKFLAYSKQIPLLCINHLEGHILSGNLLPREDRPEYPYLTLLVSGGHTELILVEDFRKYKVVCRTKDDAVGEAFDKSATLLGLPYPGGPQLAQQAETGDEESYKFPYGMPEDDTAFSFSGIKTSIAREVKKFGAAKLDPQVVANLSASIEKCLIDNLLLKTKKAITKYNLKGILVVGGVAANKRLRKELTKLCQKNSLKLIAPEGRWCTDNAAMIAVAAMAIYQRNLDCYGSWRKTSKKRNLAPDVEFDIGPLPRWPIETINI